MVAQLSNHKGLLVIRVVRQRRGAWTKMLLPGQAALPFCFLSLQGQMVTLVLMTERMSRRLDGDNPFSSYNTTDGV